MPDTGPCAPERLVVVAVGRRRFGLPLRDVRGIQGRGSAGATAAYRGSLVPVVDGAALGLEVPASAGGEVVILDGDGEVAFAVDSVEGFFDADEIRELPDLVAPFVRGVIRGIALGPGGELLVVDAAALARAAGSAPCGRGAGEA